MSGARPRVAVVHPAAPRSRSGNRVTALRWARCLRALGLRPLVARVGEEEDALRRAALLVALHATRAAPAVRRWRALRGDAPLVVGLGGTDVYRDLGRDPDALAALEAADRIVALQAPVVARLPAALRARARVVLQSAEAPPWRPDPAPPTRALVLAHLRAVKDPLVAIRALRRLPPEVAVAVDHAGGVLEADVAAAAEAEARGEQRWRRLGDLPHAAALARLARATCLLVPSRFEGGANAVAEALAAGAPVLATRIDATTALLGEDHPGLFPVGDDAALAALLGRLAAEDGLRDELARRSAARRPLVDPAREREAWRALLAELGVPAAP